MLVGVIGHRDLVAEQVPAIRAAVEALLKALQAGQADVRIRLLSAMAEGADLLVADIACDLGIDVIALLPFSAQQCNDLLYEIRCARRSTSTGGSRASDISVSGFESAGERFGTIEQGLPSALATLLDRIAEFRAFAIRRRIRA